VSARALQHVNPIGDFLDFDLDLAVVLVLAEGKRGKEKNKHSGDERSAHAVLLKEANCKLEVGFEENALMEMQNQDPSTRVSRAGECAREPSLAQDDSLPHVRHALLWNNLYN